MLYRLPDAIFYGEILYYFTCQDLSNLLELYPPTCKWTNVFRSIMERECERGFARFRERERRPWSETKNLIYWTVLCFRPRFETHFTREIVSYTGVHFNLVHEFFHHVQDPLKWEKWEHVMTGVESWRQTTHFYKLLQHLYTTTK